MYSYGKRLAILRFFPCVVFVFNMRLLCAFTTIQLVMFVYKHFILAQNEIEKGIYFDLVEYRFRRISSLVYSMRHKPQTEYLRLYGWNHQLE